jgi:hypothetical protein
MLIHPRRRNTILSVGVLASLLIAGAPASAEDCSARNSARATVPEIAGNPEKFTDRCVAIDGVTQGIYLFESVDGVYLQPPDRINPASSGFRLGLDHFFGKLNGEYRHVSILGRVQDCGTIRDVVLATAEEEGEVAWVSGYCHYFNGPYVYVHRFQLRSGRPFKRRMGRYEREDYGDLVPAPADWAHRAKVEALAGEFLRALRAGDREKLLWIHFREVGLEWEDDERELIQFLFRSRKSPFAAIRTRVGASPEQIILLKRADLHDESSGYSSTICFCREATCAGRWPIATFDADNVPSRPYACTEVSPYLSDGRTVPHFMTIIGKGGLAEPRK